MGLNTTCRLGPRTELLQVWAAIDVVVSHQSSPFRAMELLQKAVDGDIVTAAALSVRGSVILHLEWQILPLALKMLSL